MLQPDVVTSLRSALHTVGSLRPTCRLEGKDEPLIDGEAYEQQRAVGSDVDHTDDDIAHVPSWREARADPVAALERTRVTSEMTQWTVARRRRVEDVAGEERQQDRLTDDGRHDGGRGVAGKAPELCASPRLSGLGHKFLGESLSHASGSLR